MERLRFISQDIGIFGGADVAKARLLDGNELTLDFYCS